jgi:hypothetical protein
VVLLRPYLLWLAHELLCFLIVKTSDKKAIFAGVAEGIIKSASRNEKMKG